MIVIDREPAERYQGEHKNTVAVVRPGGEGSYLDGIRVWRTDAGETYISVEQKNWMSAEDAGVLSRCLTYAAMVAEEQSPPPPLTFQEPADRLRLTE